VLATSIAVLFTVCIPIRTGAEAQAGELNGAQQLIERMSVAATSRNYDGVFVYRRGERSDTMRIIHRTDEEGTIERLVSLSGNATEVIRNGEQVICIYPEQRTVVVERGHRSKILPTSFSQPLTKIAEHYRFSSAGVDRIAGRRTSIVAIEAIEPTLYGYKLWIDEASDLLLKSTVIDVDGATLEEILFTHIELPEHIADELLEPDISGRGYTWVTQENVSSEQVTPVAINWKVGWLPSGFQMNQHEVQAFATSPMPVDHMVFSDGLAMVSVFVEKHAEKDGALIDGLTSRGAVAAYTKSLGEYQVTVVGEVPSRTLQQIAGSISKSNADGIR